MKQFVNFLGIGALATATHYLLLIICVEIGGFPVVPASGIGALAGAITSYYLNWNYTFNSSLPHRATMPKFFAVAGLAVVTNTILMKLFFDALQIPYLLAQMITTVLLIIITFGLNKAWSFKDDTPTN